MNGKAAFFTVTDGRKGADEDKRNFETIFWRYLGLEPLTGDENESSVVNLTKEQWTGSNRGSGDCTSSWVSKIKNTDYTQSDCVLLAFSSHGHEAISRNNVREPALILNHNDTDQLHLSDLNDTHQLYLSDVLKTLKDIPTLRGKPKIILWISCRYFTKSVANFLNGLPKVSPTEKGCLGKPDIDIEIITDKEVIFKCKKEVNVAEYEIQYSLRNPSDQWYLANISITKDEDPWIYLLVENLQPDTEYCFVIRGRNKAGLCGPFEKIETRTFDETDINENADDPMIDAGEPKDDEGVSKTIKSENCCIYDRQVALLCHEFHDEPEDVGVSIKEIIGGPINENVASTSQSHDDGLWDFFKQTIGELREKASNNSDSNANTNASTKTIPLEEETTVDITKSKRRFIVSRVDESEAKEVFSSDHIPNDFVIVYGTTRGGVSKRSEIRGSWAVSSLEDTIREERSQVDFNFFHILTKAAQKMSKKSSEDLEFHIRSGKKSILCFSHTLTKPICFKKKAMDKPPNLAGGTDLTQLAQILNIK